MTREFGRAGVVGGGAVREMFSRIAGRYDLLNSVLSLGLDRFWRREAARLALEPLVALERGTGAVLDAATGTGELALAMKSMEPQTRVVGVDFSQPMLELAGRKSRRRALEVELVQGDVLDLPFDDDTFGAATIAYGLRNLSDLEAGLAELRRVLRPGGRLVILEFPPPPEGMFGSLFRFYFLNVLPRIGGWISGSREAYEYLPTSVLAFPRPPQLARLLNEAGFTGVRFRLQSYGVSAIFSGEKTA
ncbi:MAG: bifunctional demethylmenaquinone methyltransferase/2-methoxy-6-polyprenyl-1,4-benzoquinol methylase UbiE [Trueperaceae bacterium]